MDSIFLHMFLWEHFKALALMPVEYSASVLGGTGAVSSVKNIYRAQALRWLAQSCRAISRYLRL